MTGDHDVHGCPECADARKVIARDLDVEPSPVERDLARAIEHMRAVLYAPRAAVEPAPIVAVDPSAEAVGDLLADWLEHRGFVPPSAVDLGPAVIAIVEAVRQQEDR